MSAVTTYRHFKKHDEIFMGMNFFTLIAVIVSALSLFYIALSFKLAINSPLLLFMALIWMIVIALIIKAGSDDEVQGFYSSIFTHPLADHIYALKSGMEQPSLEKIIGINFKSDHLSSAEDDLIAVLKLENGLQWLNLDPSQKERISENWARFLAQMQSTSNLKNYFASGINHGDSVQAFIALSRLVPKLPITALRSSSACSLTDESTPLPRTRKPCSRQFQNKSAMHEPDNIAVAQQCHEQWFQKILNSYKFIPEYDFYLIIKHKIQRNKNHELINWLRRLMPSPLSEHELNTELAMLKQKIELSLMVLRGMNIEAKQLVDNELEDFYKNYHPTHIRSKAASDIDITSNPNHLYDKGKYIELAGSYYQCLRLSTVPDSGELGLWLTEILSSLKTESYLSVNWTHRDAHRDRRRAEQKAEIVRQLAKGSRSSTQAIISENNQIAADLINHPQSYDLNISILIKAKSLKELQEESLRVTKPYRGARIAQLDRQQLNNYISSLPFASVRLGSRAQLYASSGFAGACFPFLKNELGTKKGAIMGISLENHRPVYLDEYDRSVCHNRSINFIGDSGSGKTVAAKLAVKRRLERGGSFVILDNTTDGWQFFVDYYGGKTIEIDSAVSSDGLGYFAPLELPDNPSSSEINNQIERVVKLLSLIKNRSSELSTEEEFFLVRTLTNLYELKSKPSLSDLYKHLEFQDYSREMSLSYQRAIAPYCSCTKGIYSALMDGSRARISNQEKLLLITLSKVESDANYLPVALFLVMNYVSQRVVFKRETALTLIVDEAWKIFTGTKAKLGKDALSFFARAGRGMDLGLWTISQKPQDLPREVHSSASCTLCFQLKENADKQELAAATGLSTMEARLIQHNALNEPGNCFLKTTRSAGLMQIVMDPLEACISNSTRDYATRREQIFLKHLVDSRADAALKTVKALIG